MSQYKLLIGPLSYQIEEDPLLLTITLTTLSKEQNLPAFFVKGEFAFLIEMLTKATGNKINPIKVITTFKVTDPAVRDYFGKLEQGPQNSISFQLADLQKPFNSSSTSLLSYLEPELKKRLAELDVDDSYAKRVRSSLVELLPRGAANIEDVATELGLSKRTLQRKLKAENSNFQQQLNATREMLAKNYLLNTNLSIDEIAFLLAYQETSSFQRAFSLWTGMSINQFRASK